MMHQKRKLTVHAPSFGNRKIIGSDTLVREVVQGRFVLLHFFTGGCINCLHLLKELEPYDATEGLVVMGVHTGKFDAEREERWVEALTHRLGIDHPVINDADGRLWDAYGVRAWPTLVLVTPDGYEAARVSGEGKTAQIVEVFGSMYGKGDVKRRSVPRGKTADRSGGYAKVETDGAHLFLSDPSSGRVDVATHDGTLLHTIGSFEEPQGIVVHNGILYVADRAAGRIVAIDLLGADAGRKRVIASGLRSPWGLAANHEGLQIAEAGSHKIVQIAWADGRVETLAGIGAEGVREGDALKEALFAQPTDLAWLDEVLYVIDAEGSALRAIEAGRVETPVGWDLFTFGDNDGIGEAVRLQHPEGICAGIGGCGNQRIFLCDTYNGKVKVFDPLTSRVMTLIDGLRMPTGIAKQECRLYVTEAMSKEVVVFDIKTMRQERMTLR